MTTDQRILRYNIGVSDDPIEVPAGPILHVAPQRFPGSPGRLELWIQTKTMSTFPNSAPLGTQTILTLPTGRTVPEGADHLATVLDHGLVWHIYRYTEPSPYGTDCDCHHCEAERNKESWDL